MKEWDFSGYASRNDIRCADGRVIRKGAFQEQDGAKVPLVYMHDHDNLDNVIGHAVMECRPDGLYCYGKFNDSPKGQLAKSQVYNGDLDSLSIWANDLVERGKNVVHGVIREISLVLSGANPGAHIETLAISHSEDGSGTEAIIYPGEFISMEELDDISEPTEEVIAHSGTEEQPKEEAKEEAPKEPEKKEEPKKEEKETTEMAEEKTVKDVFDAMTEEQQNVVLFMIAQALKENKKNGGADMAHSVFEEGTQYESNRSILSHDAFKEIVKAAKKLGSMKEALVEFANDNCLAHDGTDDRQTYGIRDIEYLFPDAKALNDEPLLIQDDDSWVAEIIDGARHQPFSRVKTTFANITEDEARALGYIKGKLKKEEVFSLGKRTSSPQTIYKKQKLDRDDILDITGFDVLAFVKREMRIKLNEELARAILIGDGRASSSDDKILEAHIRPIFNDEDLFTIKVNLTFDASDDESAKAKKFIKGVIKNRKLYKGSGNPTLFTTEDMLVEMLLIEDGIGHALYADEQALARTLRVKKIVTVPQMDGLVRNDAKEAKNYNVHGVLVNMKDYTIGADKGGEINMFEDFDIDYNQEKFLLETRCSGMLTVPFSAMVIESEKTA